HRREIDDARLQIGWSNNDIERAVACARAYGEIVCAELLVEPFAHRLRTFDVWGFAEVLLVTPEDDAAVRGVPLLQSNGVDGHVFVAPRVVTGNSARFIEAGGDIRAVQCNLVCPLWLSSIDVRFT